MADQFDDDPSFWGEQPTRRLQRPGANKRAEFERTREHKVVPRRPSAPPPPFYDQAQYADTDPVEGGDDQAWDDFGAGDVDPWVAEPPARRSALGVDPRLMRIGALAAAAVLLVPLVMAVTADGGSGDGVRSEGGASTVVTTLAPQSASTLDSGVVEITAAVRPVPSDADVDTDDDADAVAAAEALGEKGSTDDDSDEGSDAPVAASDEQATASEPACAGTYTVVAGDYWLRFVESSGATLEEWLDANGAEPETQMYEGDELCIPAGAQAPSAPAAVAPDTAAPDTAAPRPPIRRHTAAPEPASETTTPAPRPRPRRAAPAPETTAPAPAPPAPAPTVPQGAPSTEGVCGALPTQNGSTTAGPAEVEAIIREIWPDDIEVRALCIAKREANLRPDLNNWCCYGVFALYFTYIPNDLKQQFGIDDPSDLWDARTNIALAYQIYLRGGWDPWSQTDPG